MKVKLTKAEKELLRRLAASGGRAGSRAKKSASAKARWQKYREQQGK